MVSHAVVHSAPILCAYEESVTSQCIIPPDIPEPSIGLLLGVGVVLSLARRKK
jgi:hypothetical protein